MCHVLFAGISSRKKSKGHAEFWRLDNNAANACSVAIYEKISIVAKQAVRAAKVAASHDARIAIAGKQGILIAR